MLASRGGTMPTLRDLNTAEEHNNKSKMIFNASAASNFWISRDLVKWNRHTFGNIEQQIRETNQNLERIQQNVQHYDRSKDEIVMRKRLEFLLKWEEIRWAQ
ncbi:uncharacterized protein G2W53_037058 [Senna tora]|uniref:Uncharacterized protein n=1 Tax=Senna tora TaxID=362788 RepID=A0A834SWX1_9FABA|nr:uncharacterized protein G2W53_037058 [Senna tora]